MTFVNALDVDRVRKQRERRRQIDHAHYDALRKLRDRHRNEYDIYFAEAKRQRGVK